MDLTPLRESSRIANGRYRPSALPGRPPAPCHGRTPARVWRADGQPVSAAGAVRTACTSAVVNG